MATCSLHVRWSMPKRSAAWATVTTSSIVASRSHAAWAPVARVTTGVRIPSRTSAGPPARLRHHARPRHHGPISGVASPRPAELLAMGPAGDRFATRRSEPACRPAEWHDGHRPDVVGQAEKLPERVGPLYRQGGH